MVYLQIIPSNMFQEVTFYMDYAMTSIVALATCFVDRKATHHKFKEMDETTPLLSANNTEQAEAKIQVRYL